MDTLPEMAVFARVVQLRSFTAAAKDLGLSKSAISKQVSRLEDRLGARLLNRTTRRLSLTEVGEAFYERCARIVDEARAAEAEAMNLADAPRGVLRINAPMTFGTQHLAPAIPAFLDLYPDIEMDLVLDDRIVDLIAEGFDAGVRITSMADSSLVVRRIAPSRHIICAAPAYLEKHGRPTVPDDLRDHNCLGYSYRARGADWTVIGPDGPVSVPVRGGLRTNNGDVLRTAALAGVGIVAAPTFNVGGDLRSGRLVALFEEAVPATHAIYAVYPHRRHVLPKVRAFVDFLAERLGPEPYWDR